MGLGTIFIFPSIIEPLAWLAMFVFCFIILARFCEKKFFLNGLITGFIILVLIDLIHFSFFDAYFHHHAEWAHTHATYEQIKWGDLFFSPVLGIAFGLVLGLFTWVASLILGKRTAAPSLPNDIV